MNAAVRADALVLLVLSRAVRGDAEAAGEAQRELDRLAVGVDTQPVRAGALLAGGVLARECGASAEARRMLQDAADLYEQAALPFEAASARLELARALDRRGAAAAQAQAALAPCERRHVRDREAVRDLPGRLTDPDGRVHHSRPARPREPALRLSGGPVGTDGKEGAMQELDGRAQWESAAPGWARWEETIAAWMGPATEAMLAMAGVTAEVRVLDLACGAGSQTLEAARRAGPHGHVVASDLARTMLHHVRESARAAGLDNVSTVAGAAEELELPGGSFDAVICRLGLMLFADPAAALRAARLALRPGGRLAVVVFTTPSANPFMARSMEVLLRHAGKTPPAPGQPGILALGGPGAIESLLGGSGFVDVERRALAVPLRMPSAARALAMMQDAFGAYRAVLADCDEAVRTAAWAEVEELLRSFETPAGFSAPAEVVVAAGVRPA